MAPAADWRSATQYQYLSGLDRPGFAWEFLRRNAAYQHDYNRLEREAASDADAEARSRLIQRWGCAFAIDPQLTGAQAAAFWRPDVLPTVIPLVPTSIEGARPIALGELGADIVERVDADGRHVIVRLDSGDLRLLFAEPANQPLAAVLPLDDNLPIRATAALRLWARMAEQPNQPEDPLALTRQRRERLVLTVRALDGHLAGASYREIAEVLFGTRRIESETWKTSSLRDRTIRLVKGGIDLMRTGYRRLLRGR